MSVLMFYKVFFSLWLLLIKLTFVYGGIPTDLPLDRITLPDGFTIEVFADESTYDIVEPRAIQIEQYKGATLIYVGTLDPIGKQVKVLIDSNSDNSIDSSYTIFEGQWFGPASLAIHPTTGQLFLAEVNQTYRCSGNVNELVLKFNNTNDRINCPEWFTLNYPANNYTAHALHYMNFNPNNEICIAFGMNCNECPTTLPKSTIQCFIRNNDLMGEIWAAGIRNSYGYDFHPDTGDMWFTDNGRDNLLNHTNMPDDELNHVSYKGEFFGYPNCHSLGEGDPVQRSINEVSAIIDPFMGAGNTNNCTTGITLAKQPMGPHVATLGMRFYTGSMFPNEYKNSIFVAEHGSWDREPLIGYRVANVQIEGNDTVTAHTIFAEGWLNSTTQAVWGRPNSLAYLPDGSMLLSDDYANCIYRIYYDSTKVISSNNQQNNQNIGVQDYPFFNDNNQNTNQHPKHHIGDATFSNKRGH